MKKIFTLLVAIIVSAALYAGDGTSRLSITSTLNVNIRVMVDGNKYRVNNNVLTINDLDAGYHIIKVFRVKNASGGYNPNSFDRYELVYNARVYVKPQYFVDIVINRFGKAFIDEQLMGHGQFEDEEDDWGDNGMDGGNFDDQYNGRAMSEQSFSQFKESLGNENFDDTRLTIAKQVISMNYFTVKQVKEIVGKFTFEGNKLEIAKYAYQYTLDKGSYFLVNDAFVFNGTKQELIEYIQSQK